MTDDGSSNAVVHDLVVFGRELLRVGPELGREVDAIGEAVDGLRLPLVQVHHLARGEDDVITEKHGLLWVTNCSTRRVPIWAARREAPGGRALMDRDWRT